MKQIAIIFLLAILASCKPTQKIVEVEKWQHDTTTIHDTLVVHDVTTQHDSIYITNYLTELVHDTIQSDVAWKYYTYDTSGNVTSILDYASSSKGGTSTIRAAESVSTATSGQVVTHDETSAHSESEGHQESLKEKTQVKPQMYWWQKALMWWGAVSLIGALALVGRKLKKIIPCN